MMIDKIEKYRDEMQGRIYKHFKGTRYIVLDVALHTEREVSNAKYLLLAGEEAEDSGVCEINQKSDNEVILTAIVQPQRNNTIYRLEYTYEIPPEILKCDILISVY